MSGVLTSSCRTADSNGVNDVSTAGRSYLGGPSEASARATVDRPMPKSRATWRCGTPSATSRRIRAQSSTEITHPICLSGLVFNRRYGLVSSVVDTVRPARKKRTAASAGVQLRGRVRAGEPGERPSADLRVLRTDSSVNPVRGGVRLVARHDHRVPTGAAGLRGTGRGGVRHLIATVVAIGAVIVADWFGLLWLFGRSHPRQVATVADVVSPLIRLGLLGLPSTRAALHPGPGQAGCDTRALRERVSPAAPSGTRWFDYPPTRPSPT